MPPPPLVEVTSEADFDVDVDMSLTTPEPLTASDAPELQAGEAEASELEAPLRDSRERLAAASPVAPAPAARDDGPTSSRSRCSPTKRASPPRTKKRGSKRPPRRRAARWRRRPRSDSPSWRSAPKSRSRRATLRRRSPAASRRLPPVEFDADVTGVRAATPGLSLDEEAPASAPPAEPSVLSAQAVRADLASGANVRVPDVIGEAQAFAPATFLALLDASLAL